MVIAEVLLSDQERKLKPRTRTRTQPTAGPPRPAMHDLICPNWQPMATIGYDGLPASQIIRQNRKLQVGLVIGYAVRFFNQ